MNPAMVLGETNDPTSNVKKNTSLKKGDFMADEVFVTAFPLNVITITKVHSSQAPMFVLVATFCFKTFWNCPGLGQSGKGV
jgi:hypothetical protein